MIYNRELLKPLFNFKPLNQLNNDYGTYEITAWDLFCSYYPYDLTLQLSNDKENITKFIQILKANEYMLNLLKNKQNLIIDLLNKDTYNNQTSTNQNQSNQNQSTRNSTNNSTSNQTQNNKTIDANSRQNADSEYELLTTDTKLKIIDNLSKNINTSLFNTNNIDNNNSNETSQFTLNNETITITKNTATAIQNILNINIKDHLTEFFSKFKSLFNYRIKFNEEQLIKPNNDYIEDILKPYITKTLSKYDFQPILQQKTNELVSPFINEQLNQSTELVNQKILNSINEAQSLINEKVNQTIDNLSTDISNKVNENINLLNWNDILSNQLNQNEETLSTLIKNYLKTNITNVLNKDPFKPWNYQIDNNKQEILTKVFDNLIQNFSNYNAWHWKWYITSIKDELWLPIKDEAYLRQLWDANITNADFIQWIINNRENKKYYNLFKYRESQYTEYKQMIKNFNELYDPNQTLEQQGFYTPIHIKAYKDQNIFHTNVFDKRYNYLLKQKTLNYQSIFKFNSFWDFSLYLKDKPNWKYLLLQKLNLPETYNENYLTHKSKQNFENIMSQYEELNYNLLINIFNNPTTGNKTQQDYKGDDYYESLEE